MIATGGHRAQRPRVRVLQVALLAAILLAFVPAFGRPARASCAPPPPMELGLASAEVVFVGTVTTLGNDNRWIRVRVEEIWKGGAIGAEVEVRGGAEPGTATSVDRSYGPLRYLFVVGRGPGYLLDDACSLTTPWTEALAVHRPATVTPVEPGAAEDGGGPTFGSVAPVAGLALALVIVVLSYLAILRARRRPPDWMR